MKLHVAVCSRFTAHSGPRYIYNHKSCGRCGGAIRSWDMAGRTAYACEGCQPLVAAEKLPPARAQALKAAKQAQVPPLAVLVPSPPLPPPGPLQIAIPRMCCCSFALVLTALHGRAPFLDGQHPQRCEAGMVVRHVGPPVSPPAHPWIARRAWDTPFSPPLPRTPVSTANPLGYTRQ